MRAWIPLLLALNVALALPSGPAVAQERFQPLQQRIDAARLAEVGLTPQQLEELNRLLREAEAKQQVAAVPGAATTGALPPGASPMFIGLDDGPILARAAGRITGWKPGTVFTLDNGQQWQVLKGEMTLRAPLQDPAIEVVPGIAGRWFLQVDPELPKARVFRVR